MILFFLFIYNSLAFDFFYLLKGIFAMLFINYILFILEHLNIF